MRYGVWTNYLRNTSPEEAVVAFAEKGWNDLELSTEHGGALLAREGDPFEVGAAFRAFADSKGVRFPQGHLWLGADIAGEEQGETVEELKRWLDLYCAIGIKACVLHAGGNRMRDNGHSEQEIDEANIKALKSLCAHIAGRDVYICLENVNKAYRRAADLRRLIDAVESPQLKICLDTGHLNINGGNPCEFIREAGPLLKALHIDDNEGKADQHMLPYGKGTVQWDELCRGLAALDEPYDGLFNFEIPGESGAPFEILMAKLDYARKIAEYMLGRIAEASV
jgi:sugar phosphate isomerase/epimerase